MTPVKDYLSASALKLADGCMRRFVFRYSEGIPEPETEANVLGKRVHAQLEAWIKSKTRPDHPLAIRMLGLYAKHPYFPGFGTTEAESEFILTIQGIKWKGYIDFRRPGATPTHRIVGDWKTTSDLKYALRPEKPGQPTILLDSDGKPDIQSTLYAAVEFVKGAECVDGHWVYGCTKPGDEGKRLVEVEFDRGRVEEIYGGMHERAKVALTVLQARPDPSDVPYASSYCFAYRRPCPYADRCQKPEGLFTIAPLDTQKEEGATAMVDFLSKIRDSFPGTNIAPREDDDAPPPPVPEDESDDAPPPIPEEDENPQTAYFKSEQAVTERMEAIGRVLAARDDAPPPVPEDDTLEVERVASEYAADVESTPRPVPETVESGFVNPPEAAGKPAYRDPAEAAAGEGVAEVVEKPKKSKAKGKTKKLPLTLTTVETRAEPVLPKEPPPAMDELVSVHDGRMGPPFPAPMTLGEVVADMQQKAVVADPAAVVADAQQRESERLREEDRARRLRSAPSETPLEGYPSRALRERCMAEARAEVAAEAVAAEELAKVEIELIKAEARQRADEFAAAEMKMSTPVTLLREDDLRRMFREELAAVFLGLANAIGGGK